jgi:hypothetical protein
VSAFGGGQHGKHEGYPLGDADPRKHDQLVSKLRVCKPATLEFDKSIIEAVPPFGVGSIDLRPIAGP